MDCGLYQRFEVLRVRQGAAGHHIDDLLACAVLWLSPVDMRGMDRGGAYGIHCVGVGISGAIVDVGDAKGEFALLEGGE